MYLPRVAGAVAQFVDTADAVLCAFARDFEVPLDHAMGALLRRRRAREIAPRGRSASGLAYSFHGIGCRIRARHRGVIDLDATPEGAPMFDAWRVRRWTESVGLSDPSDQAVQVQAIQLLRVGTLREVEPGWWTWLLGSRGDIPGH